jgi:hypothetical protein
VGDFAGNDCWAKVAFGAVVGGLGVFRGQKRQHMGAVVLRADPVQQSLISEFSASVYEVFGR